MTAPGKRVQFTVSNGTHLFSHFEKIEHPRWPQMRGASSWARVALRVLHEHRRVHRQEQWLGRGGEAIDAAAILTRPLGTAGQAGAARSARGKSKKVDLSLNETDQQQVDRLLKDGDLARSPDEVLRIAVRFLATIAEQFEQESGLVAKEGGSKRRVDLRRLIKESVKRERPLRLTIPVQGERLPNERQDKRKEAQLISDATRTFFAAVWFTGAFNRWLATRVDRVTILAEQSATKINSAQERRKVLRGENDSWEAELDIIALLEQFWQLERPRVARDPDRGDTSMLERELEQNLVFPRHWRPEGEAIKEQAENGYGTVRAYLRDRFTGLRPYVPPAPPRARDASSDSLATSWRNWTRSQNSGSHREIAAPLEWTAVVHHAIRKRPGGTPALVAHDLQTIVVDALGVRNAKHHRMLADACAAFSRNFQGAEYVDQFVPLELAMKWLTVPGPDAEAIACLSYLYLCLARAVQPTYRWEVAADRKKGSRAVDVDAVQRGVRMLANADFSELRARIFGAQTTIGGLHSILHGGIVPRPRSGRVTVVYGRAGSGKSTFGLALAADMARRGRVAIVVCSDEREETARERLQTFGLHDPERFEIGTRDDLQAQLRADAEALQDQKKPSKSRPSSETAVKGLLVIYGAPLHVAHTQEERRGEHPLELQEWMDELANGTRDLCHAIGRKEELLHRDDTERRAQLRALQRKWLWLSVVVDSIDTLEVESPDLLKLGSGQQEQRQAMAKLVQVVENSRLWAILLCGHDNPNRLALTYLADTVIELDADQTGLQRRLQIHKCRTQIYDAGPHVLRLTEQVGVAVYPNLSSTQLAARRRARRQLDGQHVIPFPRRIHWPGARAPSQPASAPPRDWPKLRRGSALLLYGPTQSGKGPLLLNLIAQRMELARYEQWRLGATGAVLIVSFRASAQECLRPLRESESLGQKWAKNVSDIQHQWYGVDDTMSAAQVAHDLTRRIQRSRRDGVPLDWLVFMGIEALQNNLPSVNAERSFWPTILAIAASEEITTAFVVAGADQRFVQQHEQDMDYVFRFSRDDDSNRRTILIQKSAEPPEAKGYPRLILDLQAGTLVSNGDAER